MEQICFGVDIGGTAIKIGLFNTEGKLYNKWIFETRKAADGRVIMQDTVEYISDKIDELNLNRNNILGIGIGIPGPVKDGGEVLELPNLGLGHFNIEKEMNKMSGFKVKAGNDANIAALGEQWQGSGKGYQNLVMVTLGTGVGGGVIINGKILAGNNGAAGEIGHLLINKNEKEICGCGKKGCLEQYASATGIVRLVKSKLNNQESKLYGRDDLSAKMVFDYAKEGDNQAIQIVNEACSYLGLALANVAQVIDPEAFIIGGGVSKAGQILIDKVRYYYNNYVMNALKNKDFHLAILGNDAGIYGAARMLLSIDS